MISLVLGATGQLGANLVRALLAKGDEVRAVVRPSSQAITLQGIEIERRPGNLNDLDSLVQAFQGVDVVYHAAAFYPTSQFSGDAATAQALQETNNVLEAIRRCSVSRLIFTSTLTTIGFPTTTGRLADETCPFNTAFRNNPYLVAKAAMEEVVLHATQQGAPAVVLNPTVFFGPYDHTPTSGTQILMIAKQQMPAYIDGPTNVIDVRDVAAAHIRAAEHGRIGERYIIGNWNTSQRALNQLIAKVAKVPAPTFAIPFPIARFGSKLGNWASRTLLHRPPAIPVFFVEMLKHLQHYDCTKGLTELEYPQSPIEPAIRDSLNWFREQGYV
ncbi:NAD-dependent epimerase/dehydratase family protein [Candidatus Nitronereus thalassa]|uniref:NAD-dependent epimerase/dehydratase family protein n=1 Tax=Candidatus Nitronereus thalassa TaxID=3020898 RepID=A0ABU3K8J8_9BACT|nr:NAD-dependent epimerase/dehydratase family protein [Candidatus Nitronereus thalassa]MDT7042692.1 NAD-dependent epimerase/dehydratase family protein [Candidatus Nitronereus thalassa]